MKAIAIIFVGFAMLFYYASPAYPSVGSFSVDAGVSVPAGTNSEVWNVGYGVAFNGFYNISNQFAIGGRIGYDAWSLDEKEFKKNLDQPDISGVSGNANTLQLVPSIRIYNDDSQSERVSVFGQLGIGVYSSTTETTVKFLGGSPVEEVSSDNTEDKIGLCFGGGIAMGKAGGVRLEINPVAHIFDLFSQTAQVSFFSVSIGATFGR